MKVAAKGRERSLDSRVAADREVVIYLRRLFLASIMIMIIIIDLFMIIAVYRPVKVILGQIFLNLNKYVKDNTKERRMVSLSG
jgi:hypothetical protein